MTKEQFALLNACLNGVSGILLVIAYVAVKRLHYKLHGWLMGTAIVMSTIFLASYLYSHARFGERTTGLPLQPLTIVYFIILIPHVILAIGMLPLIYFTVWRAYQRNWIAHRRIARPTFWIWVYVSFTGVIIYWMLYHLFPTMQQAG